jgi:hypothetical protein
MTSRLLNSVSRTGVKPFSLYKNIVSLKRAESTVPYNAKVIGTMTMKKT